MSVEPAARFATAKSWLRTMATPPVAPVKAVRPLPYPVPAAPQTATRDRNVILLRRAVVAPNVTPDPEPQVIISGV